MRKRKERTEERSETLISNSKGRTEEIDKEGEEEEKGFFACYLLCSLCPRFKGHTYIGFTVNPCRRIRQHNGEITSGAWRTKRKRPWEMILCIYGFPTNVSALQFEWAWQHPRESLAVRKAAASFTSFSGIAKHIKLAYTMLTLPPWQSLKLIVNFFSTKYIKHSAGCPSLPKQMKVQVCAMDELPCYIGGNQISDENEDDEELEDKDDESGNSNENMSKRLIEISVDNTTAYQNIDHDWEIWTEDDGLRQPRDSNPSSEEDNERPFRFVDSLPQTLPTNIASLINTRETAEDANLFGLVKETGTELGRATKQLLTTTTPASGNQSPSNNSLHFPPEIGYRKEEEGRLPYCIVDTPGRTLSSSITGLVNTVQVVEDRGNFGLIEKTGSKIGRATKQLVTTTTASSDNHSPSKNRNLSSATEVRFRRPANSFTPREEEECKPSYCLVDSPMATPSSSVTGLAKTVEAVEYRDHLQLVEESCKLQMKTPKAANTDQPPSSSNTFHSSPEVEVISLLTPSSDRVIHSFHKKKRSSMVPHDIIDLTKSPMFVEI